LTLTIKTNTMGNSMFSYKGSLSGPDDATIKTAGPSFTEPLVNKSRTVNSLSGPDVVTHPRFLISVSDTAAHGIRTANNTGIILSTDFRKTGDPAYAFPRGYMPEDILHRYLDRVINMDFLGNTAATYGLTVVKV
jgi:hypothetical protein